MWIPKSYRQEMGVTAFSGVRLNADYQFLTDCLQGGFQSREFGLVMWVKEPADFFFVGTQSLCQLCVSNARFFDCHIKCRFYWHASQD